MNRDDKYKEPPRIAEWIISKVYREGAGDTRPGDFGEIYNEIRGEHTFIQAWLWYWYQVFVCIFLRIINTIYRSIAMF
ncbi:MAG: hypothetical protein GY863_04475, partial [bacterium]|nr:hypothetical protein [bacterium]